MEHGCACIAFADAPVEPDLDPHEYDPCRADFSALSSAVSRALVDASRFNENLELAGVPGEDAYETLARVLNAGLRDLTELRTHKHAYNDDGFCSVCRKDGNA